MKALILVTPAGLENYFAEVFDQPSDRHAPPPSKEFDNNTGQDVKVLCMVTPAVLGPQYFRESAEVMNAATDGPPDRTKMAEIMRRHGLTPAPPPAHA